MFDELGTHICIPYSVQGLPSGEYERHIKLDICAYCGGPGGTIDHIVPKAKGGVNGPSINGTGCCYECNQHKKDRDLLEFLLAMAKTRDKTRHRFFTPEQIRQMKGVKRF